MYRYLRLSAIIFSMLCLAGMLNACHHRPKSISFYYWKTVFSLDSIEKHTLQDNAVQRLYLRYFDVDFAPGDTAAQPVSPLKADTSLSAWQIVPVIFLRNRVFEKLDSPGIKTLARNIFSLSNAMSDTMKIHTTEIQFDCDWTEKTRDKYFFFIRQYRILTGQPITATIRLHQVKYPDRTGIPPVDRGILMYYNMGDINAGSERSIYERKTASRYIPSLRTYPMNLDVALPVFTWGLQVRDGKVTRLLNKMNFGHFENDSNFAASKTNWYTARHACFNSGYYFKEGDAVKIEHVPAKDLMDIIADINQYSNHRIGNLIFYDLDKTNLIQYEKTIFKKILDHTD